MFKTMWSIFICNMLGSSIGEPVYTETGEYAGILWINLDRRKKYILVCWDMDKDEYCPKGRFDKDIKNA